MKCQKTKPAVLLDRDGTLIVERDYLSDPELVELEAGAGDALRRLRAAGYELVVVSNQSGVARGMMNVDDVAAVNGRVHEMLSAEKVKISGWYFCTHKPADHCSCRKPKPGLAFSAARDLGLDLPKSFVIGDKPSDLELATAVSATGLMVTSGYGAENRAWAEAHGYDVVEGLVAAADHILSNPRISS